MVSGSVFIFTEVWSMLSSWWEQEGSSFILIEVRFMLSSWWEQEGSVEINVVCADFSIGDFWFLGSIKGFKLITAEVDWISVCCILLILGELFVKFVLKFGNGSLNIVDPRSSEKH